MLVVVVDVVIHDHGGLDNSCSLSLDNFTIYATLIVKRAPKSTSFT